MERVRRLPTRRALYPAAFGAAVVPLLPPVPVLVPLRRVFDQHAGLTPSQLAFFHAALWPQAMGDLNRCGVQFELSGSAGAVKRLASGRPEFTGLDRARLNLVLTNRIPMAWDHGRGACGVTLCYEGYHLCLIALEYAHAHQFPYLSVNTILHELLHALLLDIFEQRPAGPVGEGRELRIDYYATRLWLSHDGTAVRRSAAAYLQRLRAGSTRGDPGTQ